MARSKRPSVLFAFHEPVDTAALGRLPRDVTKAGARVLHFPGFDYDAATARSKRAPSGPPSRFLRDAVSTGRARSAEDRIFLSLFNARRLSGETSVVSARLVAEARRLERALNSLDPDVVVVPEDFRLLHGGLAARFFSHNRVPTVAVPPLYHEWISARSLMGTGPAMWTARTGFLRARLRASGLRPSALLAWSPPVVPQAATRSAFRPPAPFVAVALQDDEMETPLLSFLEDAFPVPSGIEVVAKVHPRAGKRAAGRLRRAHPGIVFVDGTGFEPWVGKARAFISVSSSSALGALRSRVPVLFVQPGAFESPLAPLLRFYGAPPALGNPDRLAAAVKKLADRGVRKNLVRRQDRLRRDFSVRRPPLTAARLLALAGRKFG